jgi:ABC-type transport system substrate-binding protein
MHKRTIGSLILLLVTCGWGGRSVGEPLPAPRGELRIVDNSSWNFATVVYNVFEHLVDLDEGEKPVPRLATGWRWVDDRTLEMTLRQGVKFHNSRHYRV